MTDKKVSDKVTSVIAREGNGNIQITFTIPYNLVEESKADVIKEFAKDVEIPGFRKGMAPLDKVEAKIPESTLIEHSLSHILPKALADAVTEHKLQIAIYPKFELISAKEGEPWQIMGTTCELPKVELGEYKKAITGAVRASSLWTPDKGKPEDKKEPTAEQKEQMAIRTLIETVKVDVPQILIEEEADSRLSNLLSRLEKLGLALESYLASVGKKAEDLRADYARQAKEAISLDLILNKIAEEEKITVDIKEIDEALNMSQVDMKSNQIDPREIEDRKRLMESILRRRKALNSLINLS